MAYQSKSNLTVVGNFGPIKRLKIKVKLENYLIFLKTDDRIDRKRIVELYLSRKGAIGWKGPIGLLRPLRL